MDRAGEKILSRARLTVQKDRRDIRNGDTPGQLDGFIQCFGFADDLFELELSSAFLSGMPYLASERMYL
jgi:hypothetical protein